MGTLQGIICGLLLLPLAGAAAGGGGRFYLSDTRLVVVAEGAGEPRSAGSYALRLYHVYDPQLPLDGFRHGLVRPRDGSLEQVLVLDLDADGRNELVVIIRSAGSGGYVDAELYGVLDERLHLCARLAGQPADADAAALLRRELDGPCP